MPKDLRRAAALTAQLSPRSTTVMGKDRSTAGHGCLINLGSILINLTANIEVGAEKSSGNRETRSPALTSPGWRAWTLVAQTRPRRRPADANLSIDHSLKCDPRLKVAALPRGRPFCGNSVAALAVTTAAPFAHRLRRNQGDNADQEAAGKAENAATEDTANLEAQSSPKDIPRCMSQASAKGKKSTDLPISGAHLADATSITRAQKAEPHQPPNARSMAIGADMRSRNSRNKVLKIELHVHGMIMA